MISPGPPLSRGGGPLRYGTPYRNGPPPREEGVRENVIRKRRFGLEGEHRLLNPVTSRPVSPGRRARRPGETGRSQGVRGDDPPGRGPGGSPGSSIRCGRGRSTWGPGRACRRASGPEGRQGCRRPGRCRHGPGARSGPRHCVRPGPAGDRKKPATLSRPQGLRCSPSWAQVTISQNSSRVPMPPGRAMKPSERSAMSALRSCMVGTTCSLVTRYGPVPCVRGSPAGRPPLAAGGQAGRGRGA